MLAPSYFGEGFMAVIFTFNVSTKDSIKRYLKTALPLPELICLLILFDISVSLIKPLMLFTEDLI